MGTSSNSKMKIQPKKKNHPHKSQNPNKKSNSNQKSNPNPNQNQNENPQQPPFEIDVNLIPYQNVKNKDVYLLNLISKKLKITDNHLSDGLKPSNEDTIIMTRLNIEIEEQMKKVFFHNKKLKKKKKIKLYPGAPEYTYDDLKRQIEIADYQWEDLNGEHEEFKKLMEEKRKQDDLIKLRRLHREDLFYPDDYEEDEINEQASNDNDNENNNDNNYDIYNEEEEDE